MELVPDYDKLVPPNYKPALAYVRHLNPPEADIDFTTQLYDLQKKDAVRSRQLALRLTSSSRARSSALDSYCCTRPYLLFDLQDWLATHPKWGPSAPGGAVLTDARLARIIDIIDKEGVRTGKVLTPVRPPHPPTLPTTTTARAQSTTHSHCSPN